MFGLNFDFLTIKDLHGNILASGKVVGRKTISRCEAKFNHVSVDGNFYFNLDSDNFIFEKSNKPVEQKFFNNEQYHLNVVDWCYSNEIIDADIYRDNNIDELDEEVSFLVECLNKLEGLTTTCSCCGHGEFNLYVDFILTDLKPLMILEYLISKEFRKDFNLLFDKNRVIVDDNVNLTLSSTCKGSRAYFAANEFAKRIYELTS